MRWNRSRSASLFGVAALIIANLVVGDSANGQVTLKPRYSYVAQGLATGEELNAQRKLWVMEVAFKEMRFVEIETKDPATGKSQKEKVWYLVYRATNRKLPPNNKDGTLIPTNDDDPEPVKPMFIPTFTLITDDITNRQPVSETFHDAIVPAAIPAINARERFTYQNNVDVVREVPDPSAPGDAQQNAIYGVATWRNIPKSTDFFTVYMSGFSNSYRYVRGPVSFVKLGELARSNELLASDAVWDGAESIYPASQACNWRRTLKTPPPEIPEWQFAGNVAGLFADSSKAPPAGAAERSWMYTLTASRIQGPNRPDVWRRTVMQHFTRFGDEFDEREEEFRPCGRPQWIYRADPAKKQPATTAATGG